MTTEAYQDLINEGIKGLPPKALSEIVDFVFFLRKRTLNPELFEEEIQSTILDAELRQMSREEEDHLEKEFENYDRLYPQQ
ncbi:MAG: hypothetical protein ACM3SY_16630 [Candidatus Omnitrophota bacterium]